MGTLRVIVDGAPLLPDEARRMWKRFSAWMDRNPGDLAGFAHEAGFSSVLPELHGGAPTLVLSRTDPQQPYAKTPTRRVDRPGPDRKGDGGRGTRKR